jgi:SpoVK/Ycf46/Vps4 family AAA+-type ATPase
MAFLSLSDFYHATTVDGSTSSRSEDDRGGTVNQESSSEERHQQTMTQLEQNQAAAQELSFPWQSPPSTRFADVGNYTDTIEAIRKTVLRPLVTTEASYERFGVTPARGILLYGPPGTGKTHLAQAIAGELGYPYVELSGGDLKSKWLNESTQNVATLFQEAAAFDECVIFIDEIDSLLADRTDSLHQEHAQVVNEFLAQLESDNPEFVFIAATNRPDRLDDAATRRGRFDQQFEIELPDQAGRKSILQVLLREKPTTLDDEALAQIAAMTDTCSGADLAAIVADASRLAAEANAAAITRTHLETACAEALE